MRKMTVWMAILAIVASVALVGCKAGGKGTEDTAKGPEEVKAMMAKGGTGPGKVPAAPAAKGAAPAATEDKKPATEDKKPSTEEKKPSTEEKK